MYVELNLKLLSVYEQTVPPHVQHNNLFNYSPTNKMIKFNNIDLTAANVAVIKFVRTPAYIHKWMYANSTVASLSQMFQ